jgi:hypothetical protein
MDDFETFIRKFLGPLTEAQIQEIVAKHERIVAERIEEAATKLQAS